MSASPRFSDWQLRFDAFVRERRSMPFAWGRNDCGTFAADCVQALTGERVLPELRTYRNARQAIAAQRAGGGLDALATRAFGAPISARMAGVGDVVLVKMGKRQAIGVCNGVTVLGPGPSGLVAVGMDGALIAWRVG
jgi:hypothetical protein